MEPETACGHSRGSHRRRRIVFSTIVQCPSHCQDGNIPRDELLEHLEDIHELEIWKVRRSKFKTRFYYLRPNIYSDGSVDQAWSWIVKVVSYRGLLLFVHAGAVSETDTILIWISVFTEGTNPPFETKSTCRIRLKRRNGVILGSNEDSVVTCYLWTGPIYPTNFQGEPVPQLSIARSDVGNVFEYEENSISFPGEYRDTYWDIEVSLKISGIVKDRFGVPLLDQNFRGLATIREEEEDEASVPEAEEVAEAGQGRDLIRSSR